MVDFHPKFGAASPNAGFRMDGYWVWCGSVVKAEDGLYHMFASRWPKTLPFHPGWLTDSEIVRAVSKTPEGPFEFQEVVLGSRGAEYWDGRMAHNPMISRHDGKYILFYTGSTHPFKSLEPGEKVGNSDPRTVVARSNKRTGIAFADSVYGPWTRPDAPALPTKPATFYSFLTSNACPVFRPDGSVYVIFKSRMYEGNEHSSMMIGAAEAPSWKGPYKVVCQEPLFGPDRFGEIEDPFVWLGSDGIYHMIAKDMRASICGEEAAGILAHSKDGLAWSPDPKPKAYSRTLLWEDGQTRTMALFERPFILFEEGRPICLYAAVADKHPYGCDSANTWNQSIRISQE